MNNAQYWEDRFEQLEQAQHSIAQLDKAEIEKQYAQTQQVLDGQIALWYQRFADNNKITLAQAKQYVQGNMLDELKWNVHEYIEHGKDVSGNWKKELENASAKFHITKLEALKIQTQQSLEELFSKVNSTVKQGAGKSYTTGYYHTAFELQKGFGVGFDISSVDQSQVEKVISKPWANDKYNFSQRIWGYKNQLISTVHSILTENIKLGSDPQKAIDRIAVAMKNSKKNAGRLVMTEEAYFSSLSQRDCFEKLGVEKYEIVATLDDRTSEICQNLDGKVYDLKDYQAGATAPPFHPYCRSTTAPWFDTDFGMLGERTARDGDGKTYYIPEDFTYPEWKKAFFDGDKSAFDLKVIEGTKHYSYKNAPAPVPTAVVLPVVKQKKTYLTKKKLIANIADADAQIDEIDDKLFDLVTNTGHDITTVEKAEMVNDYCEKYDAVMAFNKEHGNNEFMWENDKLKKLSQKDHDEYIKLNSESYKSAVQLIKKGGYKFNNKGGIEGINGADYNIIKANVSEISKLSSKQKALKQQKAEWEKKLNDKLKKEQKKLLSKQQMELEKELIDAQDELDKLEVKTYSGIWKNDVTTADYSSLNIAGKKAYYQQQLSLGTLTEDKKKEFEGFLKQLDELETEGKIYANAKSNLNKVNQNLNKVRSDLQNLKNGGIIKADDPFSDERKNNALWFDESHGGFHAADKYYDPPAKTIHNNSTSSEHKGFYTYTSASGGHNRPLAGFEKPWSKSGKGWEEEFYKGEKKVWIDYEGKGDDIRELTNLIEKSSYDSDVWLQSGQDFATIEGFLKIPYGTLSKMDDAQMQQFIGRQNRFYQFMSSAVNKGGGGCFNSKPIKINFYAPKGTKMLYASDVGAFGKCENEMILQRGGSYKITRMYWGIDETDYNKKKIFVDMEIHPEDGYDLFQQDPNEWKGSKKNYKS